MADDEMTEIAPGVAVSGHARRVLHEGDPNGVEYRAMHAEVAQIRSELSRLRARLDAVARRETYFEFDSIAHDARGALSCVVVTLYRLVDPDDSRNLEARAVRSDELWADAWANPDDYVVKEGSSYKRGRDKRWQPERYWRADTPAETGKERLDG